uniref:Uncharacterized protein n=1 Tax=Timema bartmani TaxID=61472 RepID=A0A7R9EUC8_9NEOP|nr:unnamed protein product [Timema bartmani]
MLALSSLMEAASRVVWPGCGNTYGV